LRRIEKYYPELVEQPLPYWDLKGMQELTKALDVPIAADEGISTAKDLMDTINMQAADLVKIKVMRCGGILRAKKICSVAEAAGMPVIIGSGHESSIGVSAELHMAASSPVILPVGEMVGQLRLTLDTVKNPVVINNGSTSITSNPGLGIKLNDILLQSGMVVGQSTHSLT
jgi:muconate cycloisomerase